MSDHSKLEKMLIAQIQVNFGLLNTLIEILNATDLYENPKVVDALTKVSKQNGELINILTNTNTPAARE